MRTFSPSVLLLCLVSAFPTVSCKEDLPAPGPDNKRHLVIYSWEDYLSPEVMEDFQRRTGIRLIYKKYPNIDEMYEMLKASTAAFDVVVIDDSTLWRATRSRLLRKLDHLRIPNLRNIHPAYLNQGFDPENRYSVPYMWGTTLLAYRKDKVTVMEEERSWNLLWNPAFAGKVAVLDERIECLAAALRIHGYDVNSESPKQIEEAKNSLLSLVHDQEVHLGSDMDMKKRLRDGRSWLAMIYSGDAALIADEAEAEGEHEIGFFIPKEGASLWTDSFAISRDSQSVDEAYEFINFMSDPQVAARSSNHLWYATPNRAALEGDTLSKELREDDTLYPDANIQTKCQFIVEGSGVRVRALNASWKAVKKASLSSRRITEATGPEGD